MTTNHSELKARIKNPHACVVIWNFKDALGSWDKGSTKGSSTTDSDINDLDETIVSTLSLKSISTQKSKGSPAGQFTIELAPTKNWVSTITAGSWCAILMADSPITKDDVLRANRHKLKMFGKIISVRSTTTVGDQESGARMTTYTIVGEDWGHVWMNNMYIDERAILPSEELTWYAATAQINDIARRSDEKGLPGTSSIIKTLIDLWGDTQSKVKGGLDSELALLMGSGPNFVLPDRVAEFLSIDPSLKTKQKVSTGKEVLVTKFSSIIGNPDHLKFGVLTGYDKYSDVTESIGLVKPSELSGARTLWQVLNQVVNPILNELVADLDFDGDVPRLRLWKRVKPFMLDVNNDPFIREDKYLKSIASKFTDIKHYELPLEDVLSVDYGTNWRDKYNFVEVRSDLPIDPTSITSVQFKQNSQIYDQLAFQREGFRPLLVVSKTVPPMPDGVANFWDIFKWKYLLKEWYFDTHRMLNGTITFMGQEDHIPVGSNLLIDARAFNATNNLNLKNTENKATHVLVHVEAVSHRFSESNGVRSFFTTVQFVRGIMVDKNGQIVKSNTTSSNNNALLDKYSTDVPSSLDSNHKTVYSSQVKGELKEQPE